MRDVLFRGKFKPLHNWIYGDLVHKADGGLHIAPVDDEDNLYPVDSDTIGQYTGLRDKNSNKIFEGDVLLRGGNKYFVEYSSCLGRYRLRGVWNSGNLRALDSYEIIGNIYDNPELMEGENDE